MAWIASAKGKVAAGRLRRQTGFRKGSVSLALAKSGPICRIRCSVPSVDVVRLLSLVSIHWFMTSPTRLQRVYFKRLALAFPVWEMSERYEDYRVYGAMYIVPKGSLRF